LHSWASSLVFSVVFSGEALGGVLFALLPGALLSGTSGCEHPAKMDKQKTREAQQSQTFLQTQTVSQSFFSSIFFI